MVSGTVNVELSDGNQCYVMYNQHLHSRIDEYSHIIKLFKNVIQYRKLAQTLNKLDQYCISPRIGKQTITRTTTGWNMKMKLTDNSKS